MNRFSPKKSWQTHQVLVDLCGLLLICSGSLCGVLIGSWLLGNIGRVLGLLIGALWGFYLAEGCALLIKPRNLGNTQPFETNPMTILSESEATPLSGSKRPRFSSILRRKPAGISPPDSFDSCSLDEIHRRLKSINSHIWQELRRGVLSGCYAGLYSVQLNGSLEKLDWREVNRKTVAALRRFETAATDQERRASLNEALDRIGQKLLLVQKAALRKADRLNKEEEREIQRSEAELWRLSRLECLRSS